MSQTDDPTNPGHSDDTVGIIEKISNALEAAGIEAGPALYEEALELARSGLLGAARDRLRMLLCLDPENGEARLLLAQVFVGQQRWTDAQSQIDAASTLGHQVPGYLQTKVDAGLKAECNAAELARERFGAHEQAELQALRTETRKLRTENSRLVRGYNQARTSAGIWWIATLVLAGIAAAQAIYLWFLAPSFKDGFKAGQAQADEVIKAKDDAVKAANTALGAITKERNDLQAQVDAQPAELKKARKESFDQGLEKNSCLHNEAGLEVSRIDATTWALYCKEWSGDPAALFCTTAEGATTVDPEVDACDRGAFEDRKSGCSDKPTVTRVLAGNGYIVDGEVAGANLFCPWTGENGANPDPNTAQCAYF